MGNIPPKSLLPNTLFSNFKLNSFCLRYRVRINDKIVDIILLAITFVISLLLLVTTTRFCFVGNCLLIKPDNLRDKNESVNS